MANLLEVLRGKIGDLSIDSFSLALFMTTTFSTPVRPKSNSTKTIESDDHPSPTPSNQDSMKTAVGHELDGYTWEFDAKRLAKVFLPKIRKFPLGPHHIDSLHDYIDNPISEEVLHNAVEAFGNLPTFPTTKGESDRYEPLCKVLNKCVEACHKALGDSKGEYYRGLKFICWDKPTEDGCCEEHHLKPDLAGGIDLPAKEKIKADGGLYWRRPGLNEHELLLPVEVKAGWNDLVRQAGTYARCLFMASPLRKFALVLGYEYVSREIRILVFHHGGLTSSNPLKLDNEGKEDLLRIFLAILSWKTVVDAGLPLWCNDSDMILPGDQSVRVKKVLHNSLTIRGRCSRVVLVCKVDESNKRNEYNSNPTIPGSVSKCRLRRSPRIQLQGVVASNAKPKSKTQSASRLRPTNARGSTASKSGSKEVIKEKPTSLSMEVDNDKPLEQLPIAIYKYNGRTVEEVKQEVIGLSSDLSFAPPGVVIKWSWVSPATSSVESDLLHDCSGLFGTPKHYYSFLARHGNDSPATNHLFLPDATEIESCYWNLFCPDVGTPEKRGLWVYISPFAGHSLVTAISSKALIHAVFHACLGWFNLIQKGYLHRDISIGNVVMMDDAVTTQPFKILKNENRTVEDITKALEDLKVDFSVKTTLEDKLTGNLHDLGITDKCLGFVIDGDMAIKIDDYFNLEHPGSRSGTYQFMSDDMLSAAEHRRDYLQSPLDDLFSFYYTMQWAAIFHNEEFAGKDIPIELKILRENLLGDRRERTTLEIIDPLPLRPLEYGSILANCQPVLRAWYFELRNLRVDWKVLQFELEGQEINAEIYIPLFSMFALRGVASFAEVVYKHTKDMD